MSDFTLLDMLGDNEVGSGLSFLEETVSVSSSQNQWGPSSQPTVDKKDILGLSLEDCGLLKDSEKTWECDTDTFLDSILTGSETTEMLDPGTSNNFLSSPMTNHSDFDKPFSDTSSDSGNFEINPQTLSPRSDHTDIDMTASCSPAEDKNLDLIEFITNDSDHEEEKNLKQVVSPVTNSPPQPLKTIRIVNPTQLNTSINTGTTTIVLPVMNIRHAKQIATIAHSDPPTKRRRISASSSDSGLDDISSGSDIAMTTTTHILTTSNNKYPPLVLNDEEKRLCEREGVKLPSHYPLSREEEKNLKRIRRKIRNKVSAQDSRKRKKEYVDAMEDRVKKCAAQNEELNKKIQLLETHNKTLAGQLKRLHQVIVNGGFKNSQTSMTMMVLLLSTALFLIPGFKEQSSNESKCDLDVTQAIKMPPMPGQSRSLLQFTNIKQEFTPANAVPEKNVDNIMSKMVLNTDSIVNSDKMSLKGISSDHDYFSTVHSYEMNNKKTNLSYIEADAPPKGYGPAKVKAEAQAEERRVNVTGGRKGMRTVVLHVPKDIK